MNWKATGVIWGTGLLATWYAAIPPSQMPANLPPPQPSESTPTAAVVEIEQEAARLQARLQRQAQYRAPTRNPFRFGSPAPSLVPVDAEPAGAVTFEPPAPRLTLIGVATDRVGDVVERTAILSTDSGVLLARPGDAVVGRYRVDRVDEEAVELVGVDDGLRLRLAFRP